MATIKEITEHCLRRFDEVEHELALFKDQVLLWFERHPRLSKCKPPIIHSVRHRLKEKSHLADKVIRKLIPDPESHQIEIEASWDSEETFLSFTDLAGVRVLLLHQRQFESVHTEINKKIQSGDWFFYESPKAYTWDPDSAEYFVSLGIETKVKESHYTSVHYVIRPRKDSLLACEIQVRTLFEEIWGEVDHTLNYPHPTNNIACKEQLRVLAKVVGAGSRLVDSIFNSAEFAIAKVPEMAAGNMGPEKPEILIVPPDQVVAKKPEDSHDPIPPTEKPAPELIEEGKEDNPEVPEHR
ncbi:MAG: RelA/SpoT domain-containing protein [Pseudomonas sp.]|uniref:RelA/SpoT domain-containing protein n=1 Tax=Pseudomonas sp. TaxID=306 RepID=UPI001A556A68|nr:RelA/SpoT domain-containing protein [Pseudomonas sp.]MBL7230690.1 RelA/SpoT domain-containing protein [Pseudomonas sp.]